MEKYIYCFRRLEVYLCVELQDGRIFLEKIT